MTICPSCKAELPDSAAFCSSCGQPVEQETDLRRPSEVNRQWLMTVFAAEGYDCKESADDANTFMAQHPSRQNLFVDLRPNLQLLSLGSIWSLHRRRRDTTHLGTAIGRFNSENVMWWAYV